MATNYTITIAKLRGATITAGVDNITKVALTVSSGDGTPNDPYNTSLRGDDSISWDADSLSSEGWFISNVIIGKKLANQNPAGTSDVFVGAEELMGSYRTERPANAFELRTITSPSNQTRIKLDEGNDAPSKSRMKFVSRIIFTDDLGNPSRKWWIDPEIDVSPAHGG